MYRLWRILVFTLFFCFSSIAEQKQTVLVGVLEEFPETGTPSVRVVRVMFQKIGIDWKSLPSHCSDQACLKTISTHYPVEVAWTIAFDGRKLGEVTGHTVKKVQSYAEIGRQDIVGGTVPTIGKRSGEYGGVWDTAVYRPLVVVSQPNFKDPEAWKPAVPNQNLLDRLRKQFRKHYPSLCRIENTEDTIKSPWLYPDKNIKVTQAYSSQKGWSIAGLRLDNVRDCSDEEAGFQIDNPWFVIDQNGTIKLLDTGITLVDAGDYDNNGKAELLFVINRSHEGGFELFYDDFKRRAVFDLSSH